MFLINLVGGGFEMRRSILLFRGNKKLPCQEFLAEEFVLILIKCRKESD